MHNTAILNAYHPVNHDVFQPRKIVNDQTKSIYSTLFKQLSAEATSEDITDNHLIKQLVDVPLPILKELYNRLVDSDEVSEELITNLVELTGNKQIEIKEELDDDQNLQMVIEQLAEIISLKEKEIESQSNPFIFIDSSQRVLHIDNSYEQSNEHHYLLMAAIDDMKEILIEVQSLLEGNMTEDEITIIAPKILELLERWSALENESNTANQYRMNMHIPDEDKTSELWKELLNFYQKRSQFSVKQQYNSEANVTTKDIMRWIQHVMPRHIELTESVPIKQVNFIDHIPVSNVEQYMIHIQQNTSSKPIETQLMEQFQQVIRSSQFLTNNNRLNHLAITLRPENLGDMVVRFTEMNGEMTLKIIVSSQVTKQILESNIHELRSMFSPHQISIEEQEFDLQQIQQQLDDEFMEEQNEEQSQHHQEEKESSENKHGKDFHSLLMNEKV